MSSPIALEKRNADHRDDDGRQQAKHSALIERQPIDGARPFDLLEQEMRDQESGDHEEDGDAEAAGNM